MTIEELVEAYSKLEEANLKLEQATVAVNESAKSVKGIRLQYNQNDMQRDLVEKYNILFSAFLTATNNQLKKKIIWERVAIAYATELVNATRKSQ